MAHAAKYAKYAAHFFTNGWNGGQASGRETLSVKNAIYIVARLYTIVLAYPFHGPRCCLKYLSSDNINK
jgi:hypothetical protein